MVVVLLARALTSRVYRLRMDRVSALDANNITKIGVGVIIALVVLGVLISMLVTALIVRVVVVAVVVLLAVWVWQQRTSIQHKISKEKCDLSATFFGLHLDAPSDVRAYCRSHS
jgi:protein-S-isoprenylcysteine O-methyltransferase Ste14